MEAESAHDQSQRVAELYTAALAAACSIPLARNSSRDAKKQVRPALFAGHGCTVPREAAALCRRISFSAVRCRSSRFAVQELSFRSLRTPESIKRLTLGKWAK